MMFAPKKVFVDYNTWLSMQNNKANPIPTDYALLLGGKFTQAGFTVEYEKRVGNCYFDLHIPKFPSLLIEIDGSSHEDKLQKQRDSGKERYASSQGWTVLRWTNQQVSEHGEKIVEWVIGYTQYRKQINKINVEKIIQPYQYFTENYLDKFLQ
ncbi:DUF559 domain-containing protein [Aneurinibacillus danicus]|uniref:DUF559 domain-containing protein n=1 Tax=Aneurinibacillus danicus TaxID=267746 RepID=A0A511VD75_9BACL|nr:DUF559 domain-containing protein [Aneurinibacillus danicus]GEN36814.1 hypothetical protein ADA01nite_42740 [Aneurinibacillus danicus]